MAGDAFEKIKMSVNRSITTIGVKTSATLEKSKILTHIDSLEKDNEKTYTAIGQEAYEIWASGSNDFSGLNEKFELIKKRKSDIEELTEQFNSIEDKNNEILGKSDNKQQENVVVPAENPAMADRIFCSQCGEVYDRTVKFCRKCGNKLQ